MAVNGANVVKPFHLLRSNDDIAKNNLWIR